MRNQAIVFALLFALGGPSFAQDAPAAEGDAAAAGQPKDTARKKTPAEEEDSSLLTATKLREKVRTTRRNILAGGPAVEKSEKEALRFYRRKINALARQTEEVRTNHAMKQAEYEIALESTLKAESDSERAGAAREASKLRAEMRALVADIKALERQGDMLGRGVAGIQKRMDARKRMIRRFESPEALEDLPYLSDEILEYAEEEETESGDPFMDEEFINDLLARDPAAAKSLLFSHDPIGYWKRFPLTPPRAALKRALLFPAADLPGSR